MTAKNLSLKKLKIEKFNFSCLTKTESIFVAGGKTIQGYKTTEPEQKAYNGVINPDEIGGGKEIVITLTSNKPWDNAPPLKMPINKLDLKGPLNEFRPQTTLKMWLFDHDLRSI